MSMSDDVNRAGANKQGGDLKNQYATGANGGNGSQPFTGLPGLAAFSQMQGYTPQAVQPQSQTEQHQPEPAAPEHESYLAAEPEQPSEDEVFAQEQAYAQEPGYAQDAGYSEQPDYSEEPSYAEAPEFLQHGARNGAQHADAAGDEAYAYSGEAQPQPMSLADLADAYREEVNDDPAGGAPYEFTAEDLQNYMSSGLQDEAEPREEEALDLSQQMALQPFEARYDQQREVHLGGFDEPEEQPFFHAGEQGDADFLGGEDGDEQMPPPQARKSRSVLMFACGLVGALALGGALAFAYKMSGETQLADSGAPPLIKADDSPVKVAPEEPGGKQFAHQNKQIYDRLQGEQEPEVERIVPRQEQVAETPPPAAPGAAVAAPTMGAPHKVRTLKVMPDGSVVVSAPPEETAPAQNSAPEQTAPAAQEPQQQPIQMQTAQPVMPSQPTVPALPEPGSEMAGVAVTMPPVPQADQTTVASVPAAPQQPDAGVAAQPAEPQQLSSDTMPAPMPQQRPQAPARQTASIAPSATPQASASEGSGYVVQVASRRSQAMALAAFADLQQKYTSLLGDYQPMIQSADLGDKGVWYRLRVGPIGKKTDADSLCSDLKKAGLRSCLVRPL